MNRWQIEHRETYFGKASQEVAKLAALTPFFEGQSAHLVDEIRTRLSQLEQLRNEVMNSAARAAAAAVAWGLAGSRPDGDLAHITSLGEETEDATNEAILKAECFYLIAFRVIDALRGLKEQLGKDAKPPVEPTGIRDLRNHLIVHPDKPKASPVVTRWFTLGSEKTGVVMSGLRSVGAHIAQDAGFNANVAEFREYVGQWAAKVVADVGYPV
jgi:hypothetical protein